jgi:hypothetical protein
LSYPCISARLLLVMQDMCQSLRTLIPLNLGARAAPYLIDL